MTKEEKLKQIIIEASDDCEIYSDRLDKNIIAYLDYVCDGSGPYFDKSYGNFLDDNGSEVVVFKLGSDENGNPIELTEEEICLAEDIFTARHL